MKPTHRIHLCLAKMSPSGEEQRYIQEAFDTNWVAPLGPNVDAFEKDLEAFINFPLSTLHFPLKRIAALSCS